MENIQDSNPIEVNLTTVNEVASLSALRKRTGMSNRQIFEVPVPGEAMPRKYMYDKDDKTSVDDGDLIIVTAAGARFVRVELSKAKKKEEEDIPPTDKDYEGEYTLTAKDGKFAANTLSEHFENAAGEAVDGILHPTDINSIFLKSKHVSRDVEIDILPGRMAIMLRASDSEGYYFRMWDNRQLFVSYYKDGQEYSFGKVYEVSGLITIGVAGLDLYVKQGDKELWRMKDLWNVKPGHVIVKGIGRSDASYVSGVTVRHLPRVPLKSDTDNNLIAAEDLGFKDGYSVGSIKQGEKVIDFLNGHSFAVGDLGWIATSGEASFYGRTPGKSGTIGVGGAEPGAGYATEADLIKANPSQTFSWVHADGKVRQKYGDGWYTKDHPIDFYIRYARPKGLRFRVLAVNGNKVTIDVPAVVATTNAKVWHDNEELFNELFANQLTRWSGITVNWPNKSYAFGEHIYIYWKSIEFIGDNTVFLSPAGATPIAFFPSFCEGYKQKGITLESNAADDTWGYRWFPRRMGGNPIPTPGVNYIERPYSGMSIGGQDNPDINVTIKNTFGTGLQMGALKGGSARVNFIHDAGTEIYGSTWSIQTVDGAENCTYHDCAFSSPRITGGAESFGGKFNTWTRCNFYNGRMASNSSLGMRILDCSFEFTKFSKPDWVSGGEPVININRNAGRMGAAEDYGGGEVRRTTFRFEDFVDATGAYLTCIGVQEGVDGVLIEDVTAAFLSKSEVTETTACKLVGSNGTNVTVRRCKAFGYPGKSTPDQAANIAIKHGVLEGCEADVLFIGDGILRNCKAKQIWVGPNVKIEGTNVGEIKVWK